MPNWGGRKDRPAKAVSTTVSVSPDVRRQQKTQGNSPGSRFDNKTADYFAASRAFSASACAFNWVVCSTAVKFVVWFSNMI